MYKIILEVKNKNIYEHIMFFLKSFPKNLLSIKEDNPSTKRKKSPSTLPDDFLNPIEISSYKDILKKLR